MWSTITGRSYAPTIGGFANQLSELKHGVQQQVDRVRLDHRYDSALDAVRIGLQRGGPVGQMVYRGLHGMKAGIKDVVVPQGYFRRPGYEVCGPD